MQPKIAVIMINYKDYADRFLGESVTSLRLQTLKDFTFYIADNETSLESQTLLRTIAPEAVIIGTFGNGWGHGNNVAANRAIADGCTHLVFANMDTVFDPRWLEELLKVIESDDTIGIVQSLALLHGLQTPSNSPYDKGENRTINTRGNILQFLGFGYCVGYGETVDPRLREDDKMGHEDDIGIASGVGMMMRRETFEKIGKCNEAYFMYHDDIELSLKVRFLGMKIKLAPQSVMYHKYEFSRSVRGLYYMERNRCIVLFTFFKLPTLILIAPMLLGMELGMWLFAIKSGWGKTKFEVTKWLCKRSSWQMMLSDRKRLQALRTVTDTALLTTMTGEVNFQEINNPVLTYIANPVMRWYFKALRALVRW